eukprot:4683670-Heterocapsa_arctica.AAC.1
MMYGGKMYEEVCPEHVPDVDGTGEVMQLVRRVMARSRGSHEQPLTGPAGHPGGGAGRQSARAQWHAKC